MTDEPMDPRIRAWADDYHRPPDTPREEIWGGIREALRRQDAAGDVVGVHSLERTRAVRAEKPATPPFLGWASAAAAVLALGIGIGRMTAPGAGPAATPPVGTTARAPSPPAEERRVAGVVRSAAVGHLDRTESLLTILQADASAGRVDPAVARWGRGLLLETRLLLDAAEPSDPEFQELLEDLELILAQVVLLAGEDLDDEVRGREELRLIADGVDQRDVLARIRAVLSESGSVIL